MKNKVYWVICICPLWLFLSNCVDKFNAHLPESSIGLLIVEGSIISDSAVVFSLSRSFFLDVEGVPPDFNKVDAEVCVTGEDGSSLGVLRWVMESTGLLSEHCIGMFAIA